MKLSKLLITLFLTLNLASAFAKDGEDYIQVSDRESHTCALLKSGEVECWGRGEWGQLGNGSEENSSTPVTVSLGDNKAVSVSAGNKHNCALLESGEVKCWGLGYEGQLGHGSYKNSSTPVKVLLNDKAVSVSVGIDHNCALLESGEVACWGDGRDGQLGHGSIEDSSTPVKVKLGDNKAVSVSTAWLHTCALLKSGEVMCWGRGGVGELGNGKRKSSSTPVKVKLGDKDKAVSLSTGIDHTCALLESGEVKCWGLGEWGQLGNGSKERSSTPVKVKLGDKDKAVSLSTGIDHTCALLESGEVACWGYNYKLDEVIHSPVKIKGLVLDACAVISDEDIEIAKESGFEEAVTLLKNHKPSPSIECKLIVFVKEENKVQNKRIQKLEERVKELEEKLGAKE